VEGELLLNQQSRKQSGEKKNDLLRLVQSPFRLRMVGEGNKGSPKRGLLGGMTTSKDGGESAINWSEKYTQGRTPGNGRGPPAKDPFEVLEGPGNSHTYLKSSQAEILGLTPGNARRTQEIKISPRKK